MKYTITRDDVKYEVEDVHITRINPGDAILHCGVIRTVCAENIKNTPGVGITIFGDSYRLGYLPVKKVKIQKAM